MNEENQVSFAKLVADHFPTATPGDGKLCWEELRIFSLKTAREAMERHRLELGAKVFRPDPKRLSALGRQIEGSKFAETAAARTSKEFADNRRLAAGTSAEQREIDELIAGMTDSEVEEHAEAVFAELPHLRGLSKRPVRERASVKNLIAQRVRKMGRVKA